MLEKLTIGTIPMPLLYMAENREDARMAREHGLPFVKLPNGWDKEKLVKVILYRYLVDKFPYIKWKDVLFKGGRPIYNTEDIVVFDAYERDFVDGGDFMGDTLYEVEGGYRTTVNDSEHEDKPEDPTKLDDYLGHEWTYGINVEVLQSLNLMPSFMDDITDAIKRNFASVAWADGWNKKLNAPLGTHSPKSEAPNLMVLDVSGSIPAGVAITMCSLIDTLREQANADLIITGDRSYWYGIGDELPTPEVLSGRIGGCNEVHDFANILAEHVSGKHYGNFVVFGDYDAPGDYRFIDYTSSRRKISDLAGQGTSFDNILAFHTRSDEAIPGYGLFAHQCSPNAPVEYNSKWVHVMKKGW